MPGLLALATITIVGALAITVAFRRLHQAAHRSIPAAPDNQPGTDTSTLTTCQRIAAQPATSRKEK